MSDIHVARLKIDALSKVRLIELISQRLQNNQKTWLTTPYSEFLYYGLKNPELMKVFNQADIAIADGIGIIWAAKFLSIPLTAKNYWLKILQCLWQIKYSLAAIIFNPSWLKTIIPEKIVGADLIWDLAKLSANNNLSIYLLGGFGDTPQLVAKKLKTIINNGRDLSLALKIAGTSNKNFDDATIINDINTAQPDILFVAFGPIKQELWIAKNLPNLPVKLAVGLGGTFDYLAGKRPSPPQFLRKIGLEWLFRLVTQPFRLRRIFQATFGLVFELIKLKVKGGQTASKLA